MADPFIPRDDPSIPVLTEVIEIPSAQASASAPVPLIQQAVDLHHEPLDEAFFTDMRSVLLQDLQQRIEPILRERMREHVATAVERVMDDVGAKLRDEIGKMLEEGVNKELIKRAAQLEQQRARPRPDPTSD